MAQTLPRRPSDAGGDQGPAGGAQPKRRGGKKVTRRLLVLGSTAVLAAYAAGYVLTEPATEQVAAQQTPASPADRQNPAPTAATPSAAESPATPAPLPTATLAAASPTASNATPVAAAAAPVAPTPIPTATATVPPEPSPTATVASATGYRDGTYVGMGYSRHGNIQATVVVKGGKIVSADVTRCLTRYPCRLVEPLVQQVVEQQNVQVDLVSGATDSSDAYAQAVQTALANAA